MNAPVPHPHPVDNPEAVRQTKLDLSRDYLQEALWRVRSYADAARAHNDMPHILPVLREVACVLSAAREVHLAAKEIQKLLNEAEAPK